MDSPLHFIVRMIERGRMIKRLALLIVLTSGSLGGSLYAQTISAGNTTTNFCSSRTSKLYCLMPELFNYANPNPFTPITAAFASQLTQVPLASPASGIIFVIDPALKIPVKAGQETYGPVLTERGDTIGRHKLFVSFTYQRFTFSSLDGIGMKQIPVVFNVCISSGQCTPWGTTDRIDLKVNQFAIFATYGLFSRVDLSLAVPIINVRMGAAGLSCQSVSTLKNPSGICNTPPISGSLNGFIFGTAGSSNTATGLGDIVARIKGQVLSRPSFKIAVGTDIRFASGDALNFLGSGSTGVKPFIAFSAGKKFSPHLNVGYQWNGDSILAGTTAGTSAKLPDNLFYSAGFDAAVHKRVTLSADFLGEHVYSQLRLQRTTTDGLFDTVLTKGNFETAKGAVGFKYNPLGNWLLTGNVLWRMDHNGLRNNAVGLAGISYTF